MLKKVLKLNQESYDDSLHNIMLGACLLGSGGGGPLGVAEKIIDAILETKEYIDILPAESLNPDDLGAVVAFMGSPEAGSQDINLDPPVNAVKYMETFLHKTYDYLLPVELGAANSLVPIYVASRYNQLSDKKIFVLDGDGAGRAVPKLYNTSYAIKGIDIAPVSLVNQSSDHCPEMKTILDLDKYTKEEIPYLMEDLTRQIVEMPIFGDIGGLLAYNQSGAQSKTSIIKNTYHDVWNLGKAIKEGLNNKNLYLTVFQALQTLGYTFYTFGEATVIDISHPSSNSGFDFGNVKVKHCDTGEVMTIYYENENLFAKLSTGKIWAMAPDLICYLTRQGPVSNVEIAKGQKLQIVGIAGNDELRNSNQYINDFMKILKDLKIYYGNYQKIESLHSK